MPYPPRDGDRTPPASAWNYWTVKELVPSTKVLMEIRNAADDLGIRPQDYLCYIIAKALGYDTKIREETCRRVVVKRGSGPQPQPQQPAPDDGTIYQRLCALVADLDSDAQLPAFHKLAARWHVNPMTVYNAQQRLKRMDVIYAIQGSGTFKR